MAAAPRRCLRVLLGLAAAVAPLCLGASDGPLRRPPASSQPRARKDGRGSTLLLSVRRQGDSPDEPDYSLDNDSPVEYEVPPVRARPPPTEGQIVPRWALTVAPKIWENPHHHAPPSNMPKPDIMRLKVWGPAGSPELRDCIANCGNSTVPMDLPACEQGCACKYQRTSDHEETAGCDMMLPRSDKEDFNDPTDPASNGEMPTKTGNEWMDEGAEEADAEDPDLIPDDNGEISTDWGELGTQ